MAAEKLNTRLRVLEQLELNRSKSLSGEKLAALLGVSRNAVWKAVNELKKEGYPIEAATNKGYSLGENANILTLQSLAPYLEAGVNKDNIIVFNEVESTNDIAIELALKGAPHGTVVLADRQSKGRGHKGIDFYSPTQSGVYLSFVLRPEQAGFNAEEASSIAAQAVCEAVLNICNKNAVANKSNDIILNGKKICGILTEALLEPDTGYIRWFVTGIGIYLNTGDFEEGFGSIFNKDGLNALRIRIAAHVVNALGV
ncbi:MAG: biotin--[acetyl-CoA-carboxylase] ligase [Oscillospiraceae bacterium]|nr:biotin--[acetyl-CoA-carboxylase] ligase [Oscillospiraceae bacterium]